MKWLRKLLGIEPQFTQYELRTIKQSLNYSYHRLTKHETCGIKGILRITDVDRLRKKIKYELR